MAEEKDMVQSGHLEKAEDPTLGDGSLHDDDPRVKLIKRKVLSWR